MDVFLKYQSKLASASFSYWYQRYRRHAALIALWFGLSWLTLDKRLPADLDHIPGVRLVLTLGVNLLTYPGMTSGMQLPVSFARSASVRSTGMVITMLIAQWRCDQINHA
jgi:hypothetical protein